MLENKITFQNNPSFFFSDTIHSRGTNSSLIEKHVLVAVKPRYQPTNPPKHEKHDCATNPNKRMHRCQSFDPPPHEAFGNWKKSVNNYTSRDK